MSILVHKVGINKTLGQKSDYANSSWRDSLVGEFLASSGLSGGGGLGEEGSGDIWANSVGGQNDLRAFNGLVINSIESPYHASFDGNNDYIWNTSTGYGGNPFTVDLSADFTIGQWVRCNTGTAFTVCVQTSGSTGALYTTLNSLQWTVYGNGGSATTSAIAGYSMKANTWHFLSMSHDRSEGYVNIYLDGKFADAFNPTYTSGNWTGARNLGFGHAIVQNSGNINANSSLEVAKIYVWNRYWAASQHRHVFFGQAQSNSGIHDVNPHFGPTRTST